eukprot:GDKJ01062259.1.p1 GENE.GDKJ01062259.1~~GDKJ01062259.1.p1  ORF type:complete len:491 (-),score=63.51 GDKJ01062259.1:135-1586(-)
MGQCVTSKDETIDYSSSVNRVICKPEFDGKRVRISDGIYYTGGWKENKRHGYGVQEWDIGDKYEGQWENDRANGKGKLFFHFGEVYEGFFVNDEPSGWGAYIHNDGSKYLGNWLSSRKHGEGKETWKDGTTFEGQYVNGMKQGMGSFVWANQTSYKGQIENNELHGVGEFKWSDGRSYVGQWHRGKMHGQGVYKFPDGRTYEGQYVQDQKEGKGTFTWPDGRRYEGGWSENLQHGEGVMFFPAQGSDQPAESCRSTWIKGKRSVAWLTMDEKPHPWRNLTPEDIKKQEEETRKKQDEERRSREFEKLSSTPITVKVCLSSSRQVVAYLSVPPPMKGSFQKASDNTIHSSKSDIPLGKGVLRVEDGTKYKGEWTANGKLHGIVEIYPQKALAGPLHLLDGTGSVKPLKAAFVFGTMVGLAVLPGSINNLAVLNVTGSGTLTANNQTNGSSNNLEASKNNPGSQYYNSLMGGSNIKNSSGNMLLA